MASKRDTSNGPDWRDLAEMLAAFEEQNRVSIEICFHRWTTNGTPDLSVVGKAWEKGADRRAAKPLAFVSVLWSAGGFRTMEGLTTFLLYQLDFGLSEHAWDASG